MRLRFDLIKYMMAMLCMVFIAACTEDDDWQPGPQAKEGNQQVHFSASNEALMLLNVDDPDDRTVELTVERNTTEGALVVPVKVESQSEGLSIPSEVRFEDGQQTTTLNITVTNEAKGGTTYTYALLLDSDETDPYAQVDGSMRCTGEIIFPMIKTAKMWVDGAENVLGYWHESVMDLGGGKFRIQDWMNSGINIDITIDESNYLTISGSQLQEIYPDYWYTGDQYIYFNDYDYSIGDYVYYKFYPHGNDAYIWIDELCTYSYGPLGYSYYDPTDDYYSICFAWLKLNTESSAREWATYKFQFLTDDEDHEDYLPEQTTPEEPNEPGEIGEEVTFTASFGDYNDTFGGSFNITAKEVGDNGYLFEDFLGCGDNITITFDRTTGEIQMQGIYSGYWDNQFYLTASNGYGATVYPNKGVAENYINYMYFWTADGTDYARWNEETKTFELGTYFWLNQDYDTDYWDFLYLKLNE